MGAAIFFSFQVSTQSYPQNHFFVLSSVSSFLFLLFFFFFFHVAHLVLFTTVASCFNPQFMVTVSPNRADRTHLLLYAQHPGQRPHQAEVLAAWELSIALLPSLRVLNRCSETWLVLKRSKSSLQRL